MRRWKAWPGWLALVVVLGVALAVGVTSGREPRTNQDRIDAIARTLKCPTCRSETVFESRAASAENIRAEIARQVQAGRTDSEIRDLIAERFGEDVQLVPEASGVGSLVWILPVAGLVLALGGLAWAFQRWQHQADVHATEDDRALVAAALAAQHPGTVDGPAPVAPAGPAGESAAAGGGAAGGAPNGAGASEAPAEAGGQLGSSSEPVAAGGAGGEPGGAGGEPGGAGASEAPAGATTR